MLLASAFPSSAAVPSFLASLSGPRVHPHFLTNHRHSFLDVLRSDLWLSSLLVSPHAPITTIFFFFFFSLYSLRKRMNETNLGGKENADDHSHHYHIHLPVHYRRFPTTPSPTISFSYPNCRTLFLLACNIHSTTL